MQTRRLALAPILIGLAFLIERVAGAGGWSWVAFAAAGWLQDARFALVSVLAGGLLLTLGTPERRGGEGTSGP